MIKILPVTEKKLYADNKKYIYGAGDVAKEVYYCLSGMPYNLTIDAFIVSALTPETTVEIDGIPVVSFDELKLDGDALFIVAVLEKYRDEICAKLDGAGFTNLLMLTFESDVFSEVRGRSFELYCREKKYPFVFDTGPLEDAHQCDEMYDLKIYVTRSSKDKPLTSMYKKKKWEVEIQAGTALDQNCYFEETDNSGDNISLKNRMYCELTAIYWAWKNTDCRYIGMSHYRRRFDFSDYDLKEIVHKDIDVTITMPVINVPNVKYMYGKNHDIQDWDVMKETLKSLSPEYIQTLELVEISTYYIPYNMFIMKREVFDDYCKWLFPILFECEKAIGNKSDAYQNRYIGFLSERLMTVYLFHNREKFKILFCHKHFIE